MSQQITKIKTEQTPQQKLEEARRTVNPYCPDCDISINKRIWSKWSELNYCPECGAELWQVSICIFCGSIIMPESLYCTDCGNKKVRKED